MSEDQREIRRKKRVIEYAEKNGNIKTACRRFGIARSTFYLWRDRFRESGDEGLKSRRFGCHLPKTRFSRDHGHLSRPVPSRGTRVFETHRSDEWRSRGPCAGWMKCPPRPQPGLAKEPATRKRKPLKRKK